MLGRVVQRLLSRFEAALATLDVIAAEGLLGQDFLGNFNVTIDSNEGLVKLVKK